MSVTGWLNLSKTVASHPVTYPSPLQADKCLWLNGGEACVPWQPNCGLMIPAFGAVCKWLIAAALALVHKRYLPIEKENTC